jgi:hypothetical protein
VPADSNNPPGWVEPDVILPPDDGGGGGGEEPGEDLDPGAPTTDLGVACEAASRRIVNMALTEIGITKAIENLATEVSQEAVTARLIYRTLVDTVLRDFPWNFATEYATLARVAGSIESPVNADWTYSYRLPLDCLRVRRVCDPSQARRYTPSPIPFDQRSVDLGQTDLLLCSEPGLTLPRDAAVIIEYTRRIACPARVTDAQFRQCLIFRLAAGLAKGLGRDAADADRCLRNYQVALPKAKTQHANDQEPQLPVDGLPSWLTGR